MQISRLAMENWFIDYSFASKFNLGESGVSDIGLDELLRFSNTNIDDLSSISFKNGDTYGSPELRRAICSTYQSVLPENVMVTTGMSEALFALFNEVLSPSDEVIVVFPTFQPLYQVPTAIGCEVKHLELRYEERFAIDIDRFRNILSERTKLVVLNSPHNPSGTFVPEETLRQVHNICESNGTFLLVDEHYRFLPLNGQERFRSAADICPGSLVTGSITKCFGLAALRVGWLIAPVELLRRCRDYKDYITHVLSPISDRLATLALENWEPFVNRSKSIIIHNKSRLLDVIARNSDLLSWVEPEGGAVCYPKYFPDINSELLCRRLAEEKGVFALPACCFGQDRHVRLSLGADTNHFQEAVPRLIDLLKEIHERVRS